VSFCNSYILVSIENKNVINTGCKNFKSLILPCGVYLMFWVFKGIMTTKTIFFALRRKYEIPVCTWALDQLNSKLRTELHEIDSCKIENTTELFFLNSLSQ